MFAFAPAFPQPAYSPLLSSHLKFDIAPTCSMSDQNTPIPPNNRSEPNITQPGSTTPFNFSLSSLADPATTRPASSTSHFAQRYAATISRPAARVTERQSRESRRDAFLNKVKRGRRSDQFDARSDQIQRSDFLEQRKRFEEEMARSAPQVEIMEDDDDEGTKEGYPREQDEGIDEALLEDFIAEEENEYMSLVEDVPDNGAGEESLDSDMFYGDMEDDGLLVDLLDQIESQSHLQMDTSGS
ncbi:hypothetical protein FQN49_002024 [Arthroderma sp. PD_2]|nr:hypothetical protein FQN49_002024 [Arthroderma sp. PD_2]